MNEWGETIILKQRLSRWNVLFVALVAATIAQIIGDSILEPLTFDSSEYLALSKSLHDGNGYSAPAQLNGFNDFPGEGPTRMRQPAYPLFLFATYWRFGGSIFIVRMVQLFMILGVIALIDSISRMSMGREFWRPGILVVVGYFPWLWTSALVLSEALFTLLLTLAVFCVARSLFSEYRMQWSLLAGIVFGLLTLTRPIGLVMASLSFLPFVVRFGIRGGLQTWSVGPLLMLLMLAPWTLRNLRALGEFTPISSEAGYNLWASTLNEGQSIWTDNSQFRDATRGAYYIDRRANVRFRNLAAVNLSHSPFQFIGRGIARSVSAWIRFPGSGHFANVLLGRTLSVVQVVVLFAICLGLWTTPRNVLWLLAFPILAVLIMQPVSPPVTRYLLPIAPFYMTFAAYGIREIIRRVRAIPEPR